MTRYRLVILPAEPTVTAISPSSGNTIGSDSVTITGTNFTGATDVFIGGTRVISFTVVSPTSITAVTPAHVTGTANVVVINGGFANAANTLFTYIAFTQAQYDANRTAGQNDVINSPSTYNLYTATQYTANYAAGQNNVLSSPNSFNLYTLSQIQTMNVNVPLLVKDSASGKFKLTIGVQKSTNPATVPFSAFPMNGAGMTSTINAQGKLEFVFPVLENVSIFRLQAQ